VRGTLGEMVCPARPRICADRTANYRVAGAGMKPSSKGQTSWNKGKTSWCKGKHFSETHRRRISDANAGKRFSKEHCRKISEAKKGRGFSKEALFKAAQWSKSTEGRKKKSELAMGSKNSNWKGGINPLNLQIRHSFLYRQWRSDVFTRDNFVCQECGQVGKKIEAHHIKSFYTLMSEGNIKTFEQAQACEELWNINNGITLCKNCHYEKKGHGSKSRAQARAMAELPGVVGIGGPL